MNKSRIFLIILYVILIGGFVYLAISSKGFGLLGKKGEEKAAEKGDWQAVFLSNGQVYFGKLEGLSGDFVKLEEIYYLQLAQAPQPSDQKEKQQQPAQVSLVKLGNELHGPEDAMTINRNQILFVEDMKPESKVVEAIVRYKKQGPDQGTQQQPQTQQQTQPSSNNQQGSGQTQPNQTPAEETKTQE